MNKHSQNKTQKNPSNATSSKSQGVGRLTIDAVLALTDIIESMHKRVSPISLAMNKTTPTDERAAGISGLVYRNIRSVTELVGKGIDPPLGLISKVLNSQPDSHSAQALLSALNGVLGDHLVLRNNPLAIPMHFRHGGKVLNDIQLNDLINQSQGKLLIMVHGLCMNDLQWCREGHDHGAGLGKEYNMGVIYLHYNTGQHISDNGQQFAERLESLTRLTDKKLDINIVAHSMGGLVSRSALKLGEIQNHQWPKRVDKLIFLGTPHHGAPLEKAGNWVDLILGKHSYTLPFARLVKIRSAGITDLRYGNVQQADWQRNGRFEFKGDQRKPMPLPQYVKCFAIATNARSNENKILGDGLVSIKSALGEHPDSAFDLSISTKQKWTGVNINHMQLLSDPDIYQVLKTWFSKPYSGSLCD
jgi:pimeloyl-ACP methyl ester carboxylesterase